MPREKTAFAQLKVRLREPLRARLEEEAKCLGHSLNAEIVKRLERSLTEDDIVGAVRSEIQLLRRIAPRSTVTPERHDKIKNVVAMRSEGKTLDEIGKTFGVSRERVRQHLRQAELIDAGLITVAAESHIEQMKAEAAKLRADGLSLSEIGARFGRSGGTIDGWIQQHNKRSAS